jgi:hypothetical protein
MHGAAVGGHVEIMQFLRELNVPIDARMHVSVQLRRMRERFTPCATGRQLPDASGCARRARGSH